VRVRVPSFHERRFSDKDVAKLHAEVVEAEQLLRDAWQRPATAQKATNQKKLALDKLLATIVTQQTASKELFDRCFPNHQLVDRYKLRRQELRDAKEEQEEKATKRGGTGDLSC
jgi:hypothetical protein